jgi:hypothetical protein
MPEPPPRPPLIKGHEMRQADPVAGCEGQGEAAVLLPSRRALVRLTSAQRPLELGSPSPQPPENGHSLAAEDGAPSPSVGGADYDHQHRDTMQPNGATRGGDDSHGLRGGAVTAQISPAALPMLLTARVVGVTGMDNLNQAILPTAVHYRIEGTLRRADGTIDRFCTSCRYSMLQRLHTQMMRAVSGADDDDDAMKDGCALFPPKTWLPSSGRDLGVMSFRQEAIDRWLQHWVQVGTDFGKGGLVGSDASLALLLTTLLSGLAPGGTGVDGAQAVPHGWDHSPRGNRRLATLRATLSSDKGSPEAGWPDKRVDDSSSALPVADAEAATVADDAAADDAAVTVPAAVLVAGGDRWHWARGYRASRAAQVVLNEGGGLQSSEVAWPGRPACRL